MVEYERINTNNNKPQQRPAAKKNTIKRTVPIKKHLQQTGKQSQSSIPSAETIQLKKKAANGRQSVE
jgi:hypothetical protein